MLKKVTSRVEDWLIERNKKFIENKSFRSLTMCRNCHTFYYKKSWHFEKPEEVDLADDSTVSVHFTQCSACREQELASYETEQGIAA